MNQRSAGLCFEVVSSSTRHESLLDAVIPFTTPELTRQALTFVENHSCGISPRVRLVRLQTVPFPAPPEQSPVSLDFLKWQMMQFHTELPYSIEIHLCRVPETALAGTLRADSVVVLATRRRPWPTLQQRLAERLKAAGHQVIVLPIRKA